MKRARRLLIAMLFVALVPLSVLAADFDWFRDFSVRAEADPGGFRARLEARFNIGDAQLKVVLGNVQRPADAYMVLRLGEIAAKPVDYVLQEYRASKGKGWGVLAKSLGIKPGSKEFQALKRGHDLQGGNDKGKGKGQGKKKI